MSCNCPPNTIQVITSSGCGCVTNEGCPEILDAGCIVYNGEPLDNIDVNPGDTLIEILNTLNNFTCSQTTFAAVDTSSIHSVAGGTLGHSPQFNVQIDPDPTNGITITAGGLFVDITTLGDGKVAVTEIDTPGYLIDVLHGGSGDGIITNTVTEIGGILYITPTINITNLLDAIQNDINLFTLLCDMASGCLPPAMPTTTTTSTSSTTTTTSSTTTTTTTTTIAPNKFIVNNFSGVSGAPFTVTFADEVSLISYQIVSPSNGQIYSALYDGTINQSFVTVSKSGGAANVGLQVKVGLGVVYDSIVTLGTFTIPNIAYRQDVTVTLYPAPIETTTTTTLACSLPVITSVVLANDGTTTSTSTTSTTTLNNEVRVTSTLGGTQISNVAGIPGFVPSPSFPLSPGQTILGTHGNMSSITIDVTITGSPVIGGNIQLRKNGILQDCQVVNVSGIYTFPPLSATTSDTIRIDLNTGGC